MDNKEQQQRERAYKIWEDEGRREGAHEDHWRRAEEGGQFSEQQADDVTQANQKANDEFAGDHDRSPGVADIRPPSSIAPD